MLIWSTSVTAALGLTGALAFPLVAQSADSRQGIAPVALDAVADSSLAHAPVFVSVDAPLNAFGASGKKLAIDGRPVGMVEGAAEGSETVNFDAEEEAESSQAAAEEETASTALLAGTVGDIGKLPGDLQLMHPVTSRQISSPYGWRSNPTGAGNQIHIGQDYPISCGSPVYAAENGTVIVSGWAGHSGMRVTLDHGSNVQTGYSHNSKLIAKVGQSVKQGELIALAGTTGNSTGCHVHFEVIIDGRWHDPRNYLPLIPGQRQAMINSQRLTVGANSAPKGGGSKSTAPSTNQPDPDIIVPENDTPYIPSPAPKPRPTPTKTAKPTTPSPSDTDKPTATKSPSAPSDPSESDTKAPAPSVKPTPTVKPSPSGVTKTPEPSKEESSAPVESKPTAKSTQPAESGSQSPTTAKSSTTKTGPSDTGSASSSVSPTE